MTSNVVVPRSKPCVDCGCAFDPFDWNPPTIRSPYGKLYYDSRCSECQREWQREYKRTHRIVYRSKPCVDCGCAFDPKRWHKPKRTGRGNRLYYRPRCRNCHNKNRQAQRLNLDEIAQLARQAKREWNRAR